LCIKLLLIIILLLIILLSRIAHYVLLTKSMLMLRFNWLHFTFSFIFVFVELTSEILKDLLASASSWRNTFVGEVLSTRRRSYSLAANCFIVISSSFLVPPLELSLLVTFLRCALYVATYPDEIEGQG